MAIIKNVFIKRRIVIVSIALFIGVLHLISIGRFLQNDLYNLYRCYFSDVIIPFGFYYLLCATEFKLPQMKSWKMKLAISFIFPTIAETLQLFGIPFLGSTYDPVDYIMYGIGSSTACIIEAQLFPIIFKFWQNEETMEIK